MKNGECNEINNNINCGFDGGDCNETTTHGEGNLQIHINYKRPISDRNKTQIE